MPTKIYQLKPLKTSAILAGIAVFFVIISTSIWYFPTRFKWNVGKWFDLFFIDREKNFPTYYQVLLLLCCSVLLFFIASLRKNHPQAYYPHWIGLAIGFLFMSCDEFIMLHEMLIKPSDQLLGRHRSDFLYFGWVVLGIILVLILLVVYAKFLVHLPRRTMWLCIASGVVYLGGAIGMEMVGGYVVKVFGEMTKQYVIAATIEESLEMAGMILFIYTLLDYIQRQFDSIQIRFKPENAVGIELPASEQKEEEGSAS